MPTNRAKYSPSIATIRRLSTKHTRKVRPPPNHKQNGARVVRNVLKFVVCKQQSAQKRHILCAFANMWSTFSAAMHQMRKPTTIYNMYVKCTRCGLVNDVNDVNETTTGLRYCSDRHELKHPAALCCDTKLRRQHTHTNTHITRTTRIRHDDVGWRKIRPQQSLCAVLCCAVLC